MEPGLSIRIDLESGERIGPGKIRLLELIATTGSISAAGRAMGMSYRRAWLLVDSLNRALGAPLVTTRQGGTSGGGARLTELGHELIARYRRIEAETAAATRRELAPLLPRDGPWSS